MLYASELCSRVIDIVIHHATLIVFTLIGLVSDGVVRALPLVLNDEHLVAGLDDELPAVHLAQVVLIHFELLRGATSCDHLRRQIIVAYIFNCRHLNLLLVVIVLNMVLLVLFQ